MAIRAHLPGYRWFSVLRNAPVRTGIYSGVCLSAVLSLWIILANRVPFLEPFALQRNMAAAILLFLFATVPILRFYRWPGSLLFSSLITCTIFTATYRLLGVYFRLLVEKHSAFQVFMLGAVVYMLVATLCWIGTIISRARASHLSHPNHHVS